MQFAHVIAEVRSDGEELLYQIIFPLMLPSRVSIIDHFEGSLQLIAAGSNDAEETYFSLDKKLIGIHPKLVDDVVEQCHLHGIQVEVGLGKCE